MKKETMYNEDRFKHLICEASFDGWIENDGPNADIDEKCQLLREDRILEIIAEGKAELLTIINSGKPLNLTEYSFQIAQWFEKWFGSATNKPKQTEELKHE
jgi:hypothetical protein